MSEELKPCPFCGGKALRRDDYNGTYIECDEKQDGCGAETPYFDTVEEAIYFWNRRVDTPDLATLQHKADALDAVIKIYWKLADCDRCKFATKNCKGTFEECKATIITAAALEGE